MSTKPKSSGEGQAKGAALKEILEILDLEQLEVNLFRGLSPKIGWQRVYGGQVLAQALVAAARTVDAARQVHSLHGYFLLAGDPRNPIIYDVEHTRDGGSFSTRRVKAIQHGRVIFAMSLSFHGVEEGFDHSIAMPDVPPPEELTSASALMAGILDKLPPNMRNFWKREQPVDFRPVDVSRYLGREKGEPQQFIWLKVNGALPDDVRVHQSLLAYASDFTLLDTALIAHGKLMFDTDIQLASLDHGLWLHRPFRLDDWVLYAQDSPVGAGGRGFCRGSFFTRDGRLIASAVQEGLIRRQATQYVIK